MNNMRRQRRGQEVCRVDESVGWADRVSGALSL